jgi:hypothetical protein
MLRSVLNGLAIVVFLAGALVLVAGSAVAAGPVKVGFAKADVTPDVKGKAPVFIAGYGQNRRAKGVHDPLFVRAIVLDDGQKKIALAVVDVVGLQYPTVQEMRKRLKGFDYVLVASTHNHEGPDVVGIWGPTPFQSGVNAQYMESVIAKTVETIQAADAAKTESTAAYGTAQDDKLLRDSREPYVKDGVIRVVRFDDAKTKKPNALLVNWTCHPEALGSDNHEITADFPYYTVRDLEAKYNCPVIYFSGAVGGLMARRAISTKRPMARRCKTARLNTARSTAPTSPSWQCKPSKPPSRLRSHRFAWRPSRSPCRSKTSSIAPRK